MSAPSRREFTLGLFAFAGLAACGVKAAVDDTSDDTDDGAGDDTSGTSGSATAWASGGTASMTGGYPNPFADDAAATCALTCAMTLGPCYAETIERQDISEGYTGLPVQLSLRVVDEDCNPVAGAQVDVWHAAPGGLYSAPDAAQMCTNGDADMTAHRYFRGVLTTDADGRVDFHTCFPGWYSSRAVHIHFQVRKGNSEYVTSQLFFDDAVIEEICASHVDYAAYGQPDTSNSEDKVLGDNDPALYTLAWQRMSDGAMLAYKTVVIRSALSDDLCSAPEAGR